MIKWQACNHDDPITWPVKTLTIMSVTPALWLNTLVLHKEHFYFYKFLTLTQIVPC